MSQINTLTTGAGVVTTTNLQYVPEFIVVGDSYTNADLQGVSWNVAGKELVNLSGANPVYAYGRFKQQGDLTNQVVGTIFTTGFGYLPNQQFQLRLENAGANTPAIYAFSRKRGNGRVLTASQQVVLDGANQRYSNFLALQFLQTNVSRVDINFKNAKNGNVYSESLLPAEINSLFGLDNISEAGLLSSQAVIDNSNLLAQRGVYVESCNIYASGANVTVAVVGLANLN